MDNCSVWGISKLGHLSRCLCGYEDTHIVGLALAASKKQMLPLPSSLVAD